MPRRAGQGQDQAGDASATAQVQASTGRDVLESRDERLGVTDMLRHRARAEEALAPSLDEELDQPLVIDARSVPAVVQSASSGAITTRRRGSSPSDRLTTPSTVFTVSCTTLRSMAGMGSIDTGVLLART